MLPVNYCTYTSQTHTHTHTHTQTETEVSHPRYSSRLYLRKMSVWVCANDRDEGPASCADGDIYIASRLQGVETCLLSKNYLTGEKEGEREREGGRYWEHHRWRSLRVSNAEHRHYQLSSPQEERSPGGPKWSRKAPGRPLNSRRETGCIRTAMEEQTGAGRRTE